MLCLQVACQGSGWQLKPRALTTESQVAAALGQESHSIDEFSPDIVPRIDPPEGIRPCCSFGTDIKLKYGGVPVPFYKMTNMIGLDDLGHHEYDCGMITIQGDMDRGLIVNENNGLVFTCRGGFVDLGHVRDYADMTLYVTMAVARLMVDGGEFRFEGDGSVRRIVIKPVPKEILEELGPWRVASRISQWLVFHFSIWHEIATWYGFEILKGASEQSSSFSPEDLFSNTLGIKIAAGLIEQNGPMTKHSYVRLMDGWLFHALRLLVPTTGPQGREVIMSLDQFWWNSKLRLPNNKHVLRRNYEMGPPVLPWLIQDIPDKGETARNFCGSDHEPMPLEIPEDLGGVPMTDLVTMEIYAGKWAGKDFPFQTPTNRMVVSSDFKPIIEEIRKAQKAILGERVDRPD